MLAITLTPEIRQKLESFTCDQILVLSGIAKSHSLVAIAKKWGISKEKVWRIDGEIREILGDDAGAFYREYGRMLGFTDDGKGSLLSKWRKSSSKEIVFEIPEPDASTMVDRISQLSKHPRDLVRKIREGLSVEHLSMVCKMPHARVGIFMAEISYTVGIIPRGVTSKVERWRIIEKRLRELDLSDIDM